MSYDTNKHYNELLDMISSGQCEVDELFSTCLMVVGTLLQYATQEDREVALDSIPDLIRAILHMLDTKAAADELDVTMVTEWGEA